MFRIPISSLPLQKQKLLEQSVTSPPMYIFIQNHKYDWDLQAVIYEIQIGIKNFNDIVISNYKLRFSDLEKMDKSLRQINNYKNLPKFPPKKWFGNTNANFLQKRQNELQNYLNTLTQDLDIQKFSQFLEIFHE